MLKQRHAFAPRGLLAGQIIGLLLAIAAMPGVPSTGFGARPAGGGLGGLFLPSSPSLPCLAAPAIGSAFQTHPLGNGKGSPPPPQRHEPRDLRGQLRGENDHWFDGFDLPPNGQGIDGGQDIHVNVLLPFQGELLAAGQFTQAGGVPVSNIASWDGSSWRPLGSGLPGVVLALAEYKGDLIAGGDFPGYNYIARWDGTSWTTLGGGTNDQVWSLAVWNDSLVAGGRFSTAAGQPASCVARWDGTSWRALGAGFTYAGHYSSVYTLTTYAGELIAGGLVSLSGGVPVGRVAKWTGSVWVPMGSPGGWDEWGSIADFATYDGALYICGDFVYDSPDGPSFVARYDGSDWVPLDGGVDSWVIAMTVYDASLFLGGGFTMAGGNSASGVVRWDGTTWSQMGSGVNDFVLDLTVMGESIFSGGWFTTAGAKPSYAIGRWDSVDPTDVDESIPGSPTLTRLDILGPNPFRQSLRVSYNLAQAGPAQIKIFNIAGLEVRTLLGGPRTTGRRQIEWEGRDDGGRVLPSGVYYVQLRAGGVAQTRKAILVR